MMEVTKYEFESLVFQSTINNETQHTGEDYREIPECQLMLHEISYEHTSSHNTPIQVINECLADMEK